MYPATDPGDSNSRSRKIGQRVKGQWKLVTGLEGKILLRSDRRADSSRALGVEVEGTDATFRTQRRLEIRSLRVPD